jgi:hypothetical protein
MLDPIGPQHCVVPQSKSESVQIGLLLGNDEGAMCNTSLMMADAEPAQVLNFARGEVVCLCKGGVVRELSDLEIDAGVSPEVSDHRFELQGRTAVVLLKDNAREHGVLGEFLQQCSREDGKDITIQGHSVTPAKGSKYTVKPQQHLSNLFYYAEEESTLYNVLPSVVFEQ